MKRLAPNASLAQSVIENPVYRNVASTFAGSDAYMALEQLLDVVDNPAFDLVIVDTPPASHALELFDAPERILALLQSRALDYLAEPVRILGLATSRLTGGLASIVLEGLERITGLSLLRDISSLATDFASVAPAFRRRAQSIHDLMRRDETRYVLLAAPEPHMTTDTLGFASDVHAFGINLDAVIVNRVLKLSQLPSPLPEDTRRAQTPGGQWSATLARNLVTCARELEILTEAQESVIEALHAGIAAETGSRPQPLWLELPALFPPPTTLAHIERLARGFGAAPTLAADWA